MMCVKNNVHIFTLVLFMKGIKDTRIQNNVYHASSKLRL